MNAESRRRFIRFLAWTAVYVVAIAADGIWLPKPERFDAVHVIGALVPMIPLVFAGLESVRGILATDELQRRIHTEGMLFGVIGTSIVILGVGMLQSLAAVPSFNVGWLLPVLTAFYAVGSAFSSRRYE